MKSMLSKTILFLTIIFSMNAYSAETQLFDSMRATISAEAFNKFEPNTFSATFELRRNELKKDDNTLDKINKIIAELQKSKIQYSQSDNSAFSDINGKQSFESVHTIYIVTKNYNDIRNKFPMFKKEGFKLAKIEYFVDTEPTREQLNELYNQAYKKAERKAKLIAQKVGGEASIRRTYTERSFARPQSGIKIFDTATEDQKIDFEKEKPKTDKINAGIKVYIKVHILPKSAK